MDFSKFNNKQNKKESKSEQNNNANLNLLSLAPNYEIENLDLYDSIIDNCLKEKRLVSGKSKSAELKELKNRNIAITGDYGCGKSSLINSFFAKHNDYHFISISMGLYGSKCNGNKDEKIRDIYKYILKQILYTRRPICLPFSNYKRNDKSGIWFYVQNFIISFSIILFLMLFLNKISFDSIYVQIITGLFIIFDFMYILQKLNIKGLSLSLPFVQGNVELSGGNHNELLNENIEELIHFFLSTNYSIVIFEDLDREDSYPELIKTLSMINYTINNSIHGKTIQFIYSISDRCFESSEERTKSFDAIIPVRPYVNDFNSINRLDALLSNNKVNSFDNYNECLKVCSKYLNNTRLIFDFVNEFSIYFNKDLPDKSKEELFYLILYKISYPKRFYEFIKKNSIFAKFYNIEFEEYASKADAMDFPLISATRKIELLETYRKEKFSDLDSLDSFEKMLINKNVITRNYDRLFINRDSKLDKISINDEISISKIRSDIDISNIKFSSIETVFHELDITDFQRDSIINYDLLKYTKENNKKYIQQFIDSITEKKLKFIVDNEDELLIIHDFKSQSPKLWAFASSMNSKKLSNTNIFNKLLFYIFKYCEIESIKSLEPSVVEYLKNNNSYLKLFNDRYAEISERYKSIEYVFDENIKMSKSNSNILKDIFITNKIETSFDNLQIIGSVFKIELISPHFISNIRNINDEKIKNKFIEIINNVIEIYIDKVKNIALNDEDLEFLLKNSSISHDNLKKMINSSSEKILDLDRFKENKECYEYIISSSKYEFNEANLESIYNLNKELLVNNNEYIIDNCDSVIKEKFNKKILEYIVNNALINLNYEQLIKCLELAKKNNMSDYIRILLLNNINIVDLKNYSSLLSYDNNLNNLLTSGQIINCNYETMIIKMDSIGLISSYELKDDYFVVRVKRKYRINN